ncbi:suppressor of tumorigenicity 7 protein isoform X6 [Lacerta agilis]|uniref:suppressor of tumorigenicity 7 protein isoform X6 n=1 Tax=Lacerta agilis TaxID=80427 RepID=UPI00141A5019|nr:suppressor of tumorigenicity 7 protein isoform X6 [Lacerta agilis]
MNHPRNNTARGRGSREQGRRWSGWARLLGLSLSLSLARPACEKMAEAGGGGGGGAGFLEQLKSCVVWSWTYLWSLWFFLMLFLVYVLRVPLKINDNLSTVSMFLNTLTPKFYVALTGTSSLISGLILIFEWWYFRKYGTSFIEQVSVSHLRPLLGGVDNSSPNNSNTSNGDSDANRQSVSECKVWRNPLNLFRGAEYNRYTWVTGREPLTYYDMNLSAQDHQTFFTCDTDHLRPADAIMQKAWRERNPQARISAAHEALELNECATAYILLAEEEATTIVEAEKLFKQALKAGEGCYRRSQQLQHHGAQYEAQHRRDTNVLVYIKRRLAMCTRKLGRTREAVKMMRDLMKEFPLLSMFNIHENLLEALLELQAYADVQAVLAKYDDISLPKSATICYTAALLKARAVSDKSPVPSATSFLPTQRLQLGRAGLGLSQLSLWCLPAKFSSMELAMGCEIFSRGSFKTRAKYGRDECSRSYSQSSRI